MFTFSLNHESPSRSQLMQRKLSVLFLLTAVSSMSISPVQAQMTGGYDEYQECEATARQIYDDCMSGVWNAAWEGAAQGAATGAIVTGGSLPGAATGGFTGFLMGGDQAKRKCDNEYDFRSACPNGGYSMTTQNFIPNYSRDTNGYGMPNQSYFYK